MKLAAPKIQRERARKARHRAERPKHPRPNQRGKYVAGPTKALTIPSLFERGDCMVVGNRGELYVPAYP